MKNKIKHIVQRDFHIFIIIIIGILLDNMNIISIVNANITAILITSYIIYSLFIFLVKYIVLYHRRYRNE